MANKEGRTSNVSLPLGSQASTSIDNIPPANSAYEPPTIPQYGTSLSISVSADTPSSKQPQDLQVAAEEERAAQRHSDAAKRQRVEWQFAELFWPVEWVLLWIALRDPVRFDDDFLVAMFGAKAYGKVLLRDDNPRRALLRALQSGDLLAVKNGAKLPPEAWAIATERRWSADLRFRREDVLKQWPPSDTITENEQPRSTSVKWKGESLDQAIRKAIKEAIDRQSATGGKKLNGKQQATEAKKILRNVGIEAPRRRIEEIADAEFKRDRNPIGVTLKSQRRT